MSQDPCDTENTAIDPDQVCVESAELECKVDEGLGAETKPSRRLSRRSSVPGPIVTLRKPSPSARVSRRQVLCLGELG